MLVCVTVDSFTFLMLLWCRCLHRKAHLMPIRNACSATHAQNGTVMESLTYLPGSMAAQAFVASQFRTSNSTIDAWVNDGTANDFQNTTFLDKFDYFAKVVIPSLALTSDDSTTFFMEFMMHPLDLTLFRDNANVARSCLCTGECNVTGLPTRLQDRISLLVDPVEIITTLHNYYATTTSSMPGSLYTWRQVGARVAGNGKWARKQQCCGG
eukprot:363888-Chlamydomonas_euryale.AAC.8